MRTGPRNVRLHAPAFGDHDGAVAIALHTGFHLVQKGGLVEGNFREDDQMRRLAFLFCGEPCGTGNPAGVAAHYFHHEDLGGAFRH